MVSTEYRHGFAIDTMGLAMKTRQAGYKVMVEVGAYDGEDAWNMMNNLNSEVFSFEPSKRNFDRCQQSYPPAQHPRLHFVNAAASAADGVAEFTDTGGTGACLGCAAGRDGDVDAAGAAIRVRTVRLESAPELRGRLGDVGAVKIDTQGHEPLVFEGMQKWLTSPEAPPMVMFEFDVCLMRSAGIGKAQVMAMLQSLVDAGYTLGDGPVSDYESRFYAYQAMEGADKTLQDFEKVAQRKGEFEAALLKKRSEMTALRPTGCEELVDWYCPAGRDPGAPRTYTDMLAVKPRGHVETVPGFFRGTTKTRPPPDF